MTTYHIHITGRVQGVGFRPFIYRLAQRFQLNGWVKNAEDGVHIEITTDETTTHNFLTHIIEEKPPQAIIEHSTLKIAPPQYFEHFHILESDPLGFKKIKITPDFSICPNCKTELFDSNNQRFHYAFITCTNCGPRYSIQTQTPFDRHTTTMKAFTICENCKTEYNTPSDVRFYSQTNSCANCGIKLRIFGKNKTLILVENPINHIVQAIQQGQIVAVKGIGGYLLLCDATNEKTIQELRQRKNRPRKPFAVLYSDLAALKKDVHLSNNEEKLLLSEKSPIVLVKIKEKRASDIVVKSIAPNLRKIGVMLPYAPLLCLITDGISRYNQEEVSKPLIATSGNISGSPIIYEDDEAINVLLNFADLIVTHNRQIVVPQDDSVVQLAGQKMVLLRRSRGYAPTYFGALPKNTMGGIVAMGADLKATFGISHHQQWVISQYLGNQETYEAQESYETVAQHLMQLTGVKPHLILVDQHPLYHTTQKGLDWAKRDNLKVVYIPHHEAHFAAVLQENDLIESETSVLGVIWDGTGYGSDGNSWGGEFFTYHNATIQRIFHLNYMPLIVGDKMAREPRISALAFCHKQLDVVDLFLSKKFSKNEYAVYTKMLNQPKLLTSSMGRLFDAVACLLGLIDKASYEGEAALYLQYLAENTYGTSRYNREGARNAIPYAVVFNENTIDTDFIIKNILHDIQKSITTSKIALKFHLTLVQMIKSVAEKTNCRKIAFSGGVFQNSLLVQLIAHDLKDYDLYFHKELSPNDENIAFGQLAHYHIQQRLA